MPAWRGSRIRLVDPIGAGGSGSVWRAWDRRPRRYVAAKLSTLDAPDRHPAVSHPHVLSPSEWLDVGDVSVALLPLVRGGSTERLLAEHGALPASYVAVLLDQLLDALGALHAAGLVHRDVKPANLLLEPTDHHRRPHLWLADLDVATAIGDVRTVAGTAGYLAPEVEPGVTASPGHDLYAAGISAAELLLGRVPRGDRDLPPGPLRGVLRSLTTADTGDRPTTADEARRLLRLPPVTHERCWPGVPDRMRRLTWLERRRVQGIRAAQ